VIGLEKVTMLKRGVGEQIGRRLEQVMGKTGLRTVTSEPRGLDGCSSFQVAPAGQAGPQNPSRDDVCGSTTAPEPPDAKT
jgi:hypothetical protein